MFKSTLLLSNENAIKAKPGCAQTDRRGQQDYHKLPRIHVPPSFSTLHKRGERCFLEYSISLVHTPPWFLMMIHARSTIIPWLFEYVLWEISDTCVYSKLENLHCQWWKGMTTCTVSTYCEQWNPWSYIYGVYMFTNTLDNGAKPKVH